MGFSRPAFRAALAAVAVVALSSSGLAFASSASADPANPTPVSSTALPTAQVNGVVWTQAVANGVDYVGGSFTQSQPAGAAAGVDVTSRSNLFAYDVSTGAALAGFTATTNAQVRGIAASEDGTRIYIVGDFTMVDGQPRTHVAALDPSGNLVAGFAPNINGAVISVATRGNVVYVGGTFTAVNGTARSHVSAVSASGALLPFAPAVDNGSVRAMVLSPNGTQVLLGGNFETIGGVTHRGMAAVDAISGRVEGWAANAVISDAGTNSAIYSLSTRGAVVYATGYVYGLGGNLEGAVAMNWGDGSIKWIEDCHGDSYSSVPFNDALYVVSHAHDCSNVVGGWSSPGTPTQWRRAQAFSQSAVGALKPNTQPGYTDFANEPSPNLVAGWSPEINVGTYTGLSQGAWSAAAGGSYLVLGGEFTQVNGQRQTGLVRFQGAAESPDGGLVPPTPTPTAGQPAAPTKPAQVAKPSVIALGATAVAVKWSPPHTANADKVSGYVISAFAGSRLVKTVTVSTTDQLAVVTGLNKATTYRIGVTAKNASGTGKPSLLSSVKTKAKGKNVSATKRPGKVLKPSVAGARGQLRASWRAASTAGALPVAHYQVRVVLHGKTMKTYLIGSGARAKLIVGLRRHSIYTVSVRAGSWAGWGAWSSAQSSRTR